MSQLSDVHTLVGAYALDAVDPADVAAVDTHLDACEACAREVSEMHAVAAILAADAAVRPPASLRVAVLAEITQTRQLPPAVPGQAAPAGSASQSGESGQFLSSGLSRQSGPPYLPGPHFLTKPSNLSGPISVSGPSGLSGLVDVSDLTGDPGVAAAQRYAASHDLDDSEQTFAPGQRPAGPGSAQAKADRRWRQGRKPLIGIAAAFAAVSLSLGYVVTDQQSELDAKRSEIATLSTLADAAVDSAAATPVAGGGRIAVIEAGDQSLLVARDLPPLPPDKVYQLWLQDDRDAIRSAGTFSEASNRGDDRIVNIMGLDTDDRNFCITVEPAGGSQQPTTPVLASLTVNSARGN